MQVCCRPHWLQVKTLQQMLMRPATDLHVVVVVVPLLLLMVRASDTYFRFFARYKFVT